jgi:hypothetical protein
MLSAIRLDPIFPRYPPPITQNVCEKNIKEEQLLGTRVEASVEDPGCLSRIQDPGVKKAPDPGVKKAPDTGSATLVMAHTVIDEKTSAQERHSLVKR